MELVSRWMEKFPPCHNIDHIKRVLRNALLILDQEWDASSFPLSKEVSTHIVSLASMFHDVLDAKFMTLHPDRSLLSDYLKKFPEPIPDIVNRVVRNVSWSKYIKGDCEDLKEYNIYLYIVREADWIDASGAAGIGRCFSFGGHTQSSMESCVVHIKEKLLKLHHHARTKYGKTKLVQLSEILEKFKENIEQELLVLP